MAATWGRSVPELLEEIRAARARVAALKRSLKETREELGQAAAALLELEAECRRRGLHVVNQPTDTVGVGGIHGRQERTRSHH
jgi:chromosome segregation ATPase